MTKVALVPVEEPVQPRDLVDEIIEPPVGRDELAQRPHQQPARPACPEEQDEMRKIAALADRARDVVHIASRFDRGCFSADRAGLCVASGAWGKGAPDSYEARPR